MTRRRREPPFDVPAVVLLVAALLVLALLALSLREKPPPFPRPAGVGLVVAEAAVKLTGYQKRWIDDKARFKTGRMARQTGKSFGTALEVALEMQETPRTPEVILSSGQRASKENIDKVAMHLRAIQQAAEVLATEWAGEEGKYMAHEIVLPNGSRCIGLPANPDTARGHSANVYLDEFAFHKESRKIWAALFPTITRGYRLRVTSTPQGKNNKFYELDTNAAYSHHVVTIVDALADGLELRDPETGELTTVDQLRAALGDDEAFEQEYMVAFLDEATAWLSYELISAAEDELLDLTPDWIGELLALAQDAHRVAPSIVEPLPFRFPAPPGELELGLDIGRRRDLSVIWLNALRGELRETWVAIGLRNQTFGVQERVLYTLYNLLPIRRGCIDETGIGMQLAERAKDKFG